MQTARHCQTYGGESKCAVVSVGAVHTHSISDQIPMPDSHGGLSQSCLHGVLWCCGAVTTVSLPGPNRLDKSITCTG
eukprot:5044909-Alexandrium_andersonii.AAC.1